MKAFKNVILKSSKLLLVICTMFSQLSFSLEAFAEEVEDSLKEDTSILEEELIDDEENSDTDEENTDTDEENTDIDDNNTEEDDEKEIVSVTVSEDGYIYIYGTFSSKLSTSMLIESLAQEGYDVHITLNDEEVVDDVLVTEDMILVLDDSSYNIIIVGDVNGDGIVDEYDLDTIIESILEEEEEDKSFDISDLTYLDTVIKNKSWTFEVDVTDKLSVTISNETSALVGDTVSLELSLDGFSKDSINGISGSISYDNSLLKLDSIVVNEKAYVKGDYNDLGEFVYLLEDYNSTDVLITINFIALGDGDASITLDNLTASKSGENISLDSIDLSISIAPAGVGGDDDTTDTDDSTTSDSTATEVTTTTSSSSTTTSDVETTELEVYTTSTTTTYVSLSSNNYISSLEIEGIDIDFSSDIYEYDIDVSSDVDSLDISIILDDDSASYVINGNEDFKEGSNTVEIVVTAEDGTERVYVINVTKASSDEVSDVEDSADEESGNVSKTIIIILIVLVIIGLIYIIFKDDSEDEDIEEEKSKNTKEKKEEKKTNSKSKSKK